MTMLGRVAGIAAVLLSGAVVLGAPAPGPPAPASGPQEVSVVGVFVDPGAGHPTVLLEGKRDQRRFAMAIGLAEATGIAVPLGNVTPPRPLTHDLFLTLFARLGVSVERVVITDLRDNTLYATVFLKASAGPLELDSRPSDAIALAVRARAPIYAERRVFDKTERPSPTPGQPGQRI